SHRPHRPLHSFPTRRSSDLIAPACRSRVPPLMTMPEAVPPDDTTSMPPPLIVALIEEPPEATSKLPAIALPLVVPPASTLIVPRSEEHTSELQSRSDLVCRL